MIDPGYFVIANERELRKGQHVRTKHGTGIIDFIWFGCEEMAWVDMDDGTRRCCGLEMDEIWPVVEVNDDR